MALLDDLRAILGPDRAFATPGHREQHSRDASSHAPVLPDVVVSPETMAAVSAIVRYANERRIPLVGWGVGTSIEGNPIPHAGGVVVDFSRMDRILALRAADFQVTVQPSVVPHLHRHPFADRPLPSLRNPLGELAGQRR